MPSRESPVLIDDLNPYVSVTKSWRTAAHKVATAQFPSCPLNEVWLVAHPCAEFLHAFLPCALFADNECVAPWRAAHDVLRTGRKSVNVFVQHARHDKISLKGWRRFRENVVQRREVCGPRRSPESKTIIRSLYSEVNHNMCFFGSTTEPQCQLP